jgi:hypothetical protein
MDSRNGATLDQGQQGVAMVGAQFADIPRRLAVDQTFGPMGIEPHHPVPRRLQPDPADPRRLAPRATIVDLGQRRQPAALPSVAGRFGQSPQPGCIIVCAKLDPWAHGEPPARQHGIRHAQR